MTIDDITIDQKFKDLLPVLPSDVYTALQVEILRDGCNDPLTIWEETNILLDGHNRLSICDANDIEYEYSTVSLPNRDEAKRWILRRARARRNSTPNQLSYMRGLEYNLRKGSHGGDHKSKGKNCTLNASEELSEEHDVSERTIKNDAKYAEAIDTIAETVGPEAKQVLLSSGVTKKKVADIAKLPKKQRGAAVNSITSSGKKEATTKVKPNAKAKPKPKPTRTVLELYGDCNTPFQQMLAKVKPLGRVTKEKFYQAIGGEANQPFFMSHVDELHYMHMQEDDDGTCELFIDETERNLCTAIHAQLARMKAEAGKGNSFKFNLPRLRIVIGDMYELVRKGSMHV